MAYPPIVGGGYHACILHYTDNNAILNAHDLVLVDAGAGAMLGPHTGDLVNNLQAAGYRPEQIDEIYLTHLHTDHVGGLVANGQRVFPNAIVRVDRREIEYWLSETNTQAAPEAAKRFFLAAATALTPYQQAGLLKPFDGNTDLIPGVRAQSGYGHTPGHTTYVVENRDQKLVLWGDVVHVAALQFDDPSVTIRYDVDSSEAEQVHERVFAEAADRGYRVGGAHISFPGLGHVRHDHGKAYTFVPLNYSLGTRADEQSR